MAEVQTATMVADGVETSNARPPRVDNHSVSTQCCGNEICRHLTALPADDLRTLRLGTAHDEPPMLSCPNCQAPCALDGRFCPNCGQVIRDADEASGADDLTGRAFCANRYHLDALLGRGGMGTVYRALDRRLGRQVALKVLAPELIAHPTARMRMTQEGQALARIEHPNVLRVFDVFDEGPLLVIVLELVTGGSLENLVRTGGIGESRALQLASGMLAGLQAVHRAGLVHRDVKPGNILLTADGVPKVADLGVARDTTAQSKTRLGQKLGTLEYMSPEQVQGLQVTASADIYGAGMVLFELLTGSLPFSGNTEFDWAVAHVKLQPNLALLQGKASPLVCDAVARALAKEPAARFASAQAMATALAAKAPQAQQVSQPLTTPRGQNLPPAAEGRAREVAAPVAAAAPPPSRKLALIGAVAAVLVIGVGLAAAVSSVNQGSAAAAVVGPGESSRGGAEPVAEQEPPGPGPARRGAGEPERREPSPVPRPVPEPDPTTGVTGYYEALNREDLEGAYKHWGMVRSADEASWRKNFGEQARCARVLQASEVDRSGSSATIRADLCVDDQRAGEVHRWGGTINVALRDGVWKMVSWKIGKKGFCDKDCQPTAGRVEW